jgi:SAM-dependent methyltransferase
LAPKVLRVEGIDITEEMLAEARKLAAQRGIINIRFLTGISTDLPYLDLSFDIVTCRRAVHHFTDVPTSLGEMARVLKVGGRLVIDDRVVPEDDEIDSLINQLDRLHDPSHVRSRRGCELTGLVQGTGLELISSRPYRRRMPLSHFTQMVPPLTAQRMRDLVTGADKRVRKALDVRTVNGHLYFDNHFLLITAAKTLSPIHPL